MNGMSRFGAFPLMKLLSGLTFVLLFFDALSQGFVTSWMRFSVSEVSQGQAWRVVTYAFVHGGFMHWLLNTISLLLFGGPVEQALGTRSVGKLFLWSTILGIAIQGLFLPSVPVVGMSAGSMGVLAAFCYLYRESQVLLFFVLPVKAWHIGVFVVLSNVYMSLTGGQGVATYAHLGGFFAGLAFVYFRLYDWTFRSKKVQASPVQRRSNPRLKLVKPSPSSRPQQDASPHIDSILDKIASRGLHSLSEKERAELDKHSETLRKKDDVHGS